MDPVPLEERPSAPDAAGPGASSSSSSSSSSSEEVTTGSAASIGSVAIDSATASNTSSTSAIASADASAVNDVVAAIEDEEEEEEAAAAATAEDRHVSVLEEDVSITAVADDGNAAADGAGIYDKHIGGSSADAPEDDDNVLTAAPDGAASVLGTDDTADALKLVPPSASPNLDPSADPAAATADASSNVEAVVDPLQAYAALAPEELVKYGESELAAILRDAVTKFNIKPKACRDFLINKKVIRGLPSEFAEFILGQSKISKRRIGEYIGGIDKLNQLVCEELFSRYDFRGDTLDGALRKLLRQFRLPGEAQQIDRILEKFATQYHSQNDGVFLNADTAYVLAFSIIMLNTDLHNQAIVPERKMTLDQFIRNNRGINSGQDVPREILEKLYFDIRDNEIRMDESDMYENEVLAFMAPTKSGFLEKKIEAIFPQWHRHWFVLNDGCLYYFKNRTDDGPRCIIPLENTKIAKGSSATELVISSASGDLLKSSKLLENGGMELGKHSRFILCADTEAERDLWVKALKEECNRIKPLHEIFLRKKDYDTSQARTDAPLQIPPPIAQGWLRKRIFIPEKSIGYLEGAPLTSSTASSEGQQSLTSPAFTSSGGCICSWRRRYFVMFPDFDMGGITLFYFVNQLMAQRMIESGVQTQQGYIRMKKVRGLYLVEDDGLEGLELELHSGPSILLAPDEVDHVDYWSRALQFAVSQYVIPASNNGTSNSNTSNSAGINGSTSKVDVSSSGYINNTTVEDANVQRATVQSQPSDFNAIYTAPSTDVVGN